MSSNNKLTALESTLHQSIGYCQDLMKQFEQLYIESEDFKKQIVTQKEKCASKQCSSSEELKKEIESKNNVIQSVASTLTKLYETKNFNILNDVFKILFGDKIETVRKLDNTEVMENKASVKKEVLTPKKEFFTPMKEILSPKKDTKKEISTSKQEIFSPRKDLKSKTETPVKDESISEIEGTPTGRTSPIIQSRKLRSSTASSTDIRDKKKCPDSWPTPEHKAIILTFPSPTTRGRGRLRQSRLNLIKTKPNTVVDLTSSPELMIVTRCSQNDGIVQPLVKKESTDNDDTILPSPTSGPNNFMSMYKTTSLISPVKFNNSPLCLRSKTEIQKPIPRCDLENTPTKDVINQINSKAEESINLLKPIGFVPIMNEHSPIKVEPVDEDETHCDIPSSISILQRVDILEQKQGFQEQKPASPTKVPLAENKNITNMPCEDTDSSMSLLRQVKVSPTEDKVKRQLSCKRPPPPVEILYKEQVPRTKAEKRKLRGWNCDECKNFYDELYAEDPEMLAAKMEECSKHRGRCNPARPKTPDGFWNPRWSVPRDTEEFNRRNNAE